VLKIRINMIIIIIIIIIITVRNLYGGMLSIFIRNASVRVCRCITPPTDELLYDATRNDDERHEQIGDRQRHQEIVGDVLQFPLDSDSEAHQCIACGVDRKQTTVAAAAAAATTDSTYL